MEPVELRSERLVLDRLTLGDADAIVEYCQDPLFERFLTTPWPYRREHAEGFIGEVVPEGWASGREATWAIRRGTGLPLLGVIGLRAAGNEIGFWLGAPHRGQGIMREATLAVAEWAFAGGLAGADAAADPDLEVTWRAVPGNTASARVARAAGFRRLADGPVPHREGDVEGWTGARGRVPDPDSAASWADILDDPA